MSLEKLIDKMIREAIDEGEFDDLEGTGKPVDLNSYFSLPEHLRAGHSLLKNARVLPEEAQLLKEAQALRQELNACENEEERRSLKKSIDEKMLRYNLLRERSRSRR